MEFAGTSRFRVVRRIGAGGMGAVYEVDDRERGSRVALKTLLSIRPDHLVMFKNEFRALQELEHPNLVSLGELIEEGGQWFFTMELLAGVTLLRWVRPGSTTQAEGTPTAVDASDDFPTSMLSHAITAVGGLPGGQFDEARLRSALAQVARGLGALHRRGKVHRDIKPSNILVTPEGRVVILDFGLVADAARGANPRAAHVMGTPMYMAPEQAKSFAVGPEADWYSVGALLYQALTGRLPHLGTAHEVLELKQTVPPIPPRNLDMRIPEDLEELCLGLLRPRADERFGGREILRVVDPGGPDGAHEPPVAPASVFVGRAREMGELGQAYERVADAGATLTVVVRGESGMGKSALVREWLTRLTRQTSRALILSGRCYERESVPYKAVDNVVDALAAHLARLSPEQLGLVLPERAELLGRVFPALRTLVGAGVPDGTVIDPLQVRRRMFTVLRQLLGALGARRPLVVTIDDLQWAESDSLALLAELVRPPDAPGLLLVVTLREPTPTASLGLPGEVYELALAGLPPHEARTLAEELMRSPEKGAAATIASEASGHPMFIAELARLGPGTERRTRRLDDALWSRVAALDEPSRELLSVVSVAGAPLRQATAARAALVPNEALPRLLERLRGEHLVRTSGAGLEDLVEPYHDRVREAVAGHVAGAALPALHRRIAEVLEAESPPDPDRLFMHWREAGDPAAARSWAIKAAEHAVAALAFDRAAGLYTTALELTGPGPEAHHLRIALGEALANAGRGGEAARVLRRAAEDAEPGPALELSRRAAEQLLRSGHVDEGLVALRGVLGAVGFKLPDTARQALPSLLWLRASLRARGLGYRERAPDQISERDLARIDTCWSAALGLSMVDPVRGAEFQTRMLLLALKAGDPYRVALALSLESGHLAAAGGKGERRGARAAELARTLAERSGNPHAIAMATGATGVSAYLLGRFTEAREHCARATQLFQSRCAGATWEQDTMEIVTTWSLVYMGAFVELGERVPNIIRAAEQHDDRYLATSLRTGNLVMVPLAQGDADRARREANEAMRRWSHRAYLHQHWDDLLAQGEIDLYQGDAAQTLARLEQRWPDLKRAFILMIQMSRVEAVFLRGRAALMAATQQPAEAKRLLAGVRADARRLAREGMAWTAPLADLLGAGLAAVEHREAEALALIERAATGFGAGDMGLHAAVARLRWSRLAGGDRGAELAEAARVYWVQQAIADPATIAAALAPGFPD